MMHKRTRLTLAAMLAWAAPTLAAAHWDVHRDTDALTGAATYSAVALSETPLLNMIGQPEPAGLVIKCSDRKLAVFFAWPQIVAHGGDSATLIIQYPQTLALIRVDDGPIVRRWLDISNSGNGAGGFRGQGGIKLLELLSPSRKVVVRIEGAMGSAQNAVFDTTGIETVSADAITACR